MLPQIRYKKGEEERDRKGKKIEIGPALEMPNARGNNGDEPLDALKDDVARDVGNA